MTLRHFPINLNHGSGCYRRLVRTFRVPGKVLLTLYDTHHSMRLLIRHAQGRISVAEASHRRRRYGSSAFPCDEHFKGLF